MAPADNAASALSTPSRSNDCVTGMRSLPRWTRSAMLRSAGWSTVAKTLVASMRASARWRPHRRLAEVTADLREQGEVGAEIGMVRPERGLPDAQRALQQRAGVGGLADLAQHPAEHVQGGGHVRMVGAVDGLPDA